MANYFSYSDVDQKYKDSRANFVQSNFEIPDLVLYNVLPFNNEDYWERRAEFYQYANPDTGELHYFGVITNNSIPEHYLKYKQKYSQYSHHIFAFKCNHEGKSFEDDYWDAEWDGVSSLGTNPHEMKRGVIYDMVNIQLKLI